MSIISDSMLRNNDSDRASAQYASSQPYSQTYSDEGSSSDNQQGLLERIFNGLGAASDWIGNNVEYVENSPVGQWIGNNVECVENSPVGQAVGQVGQVLAPANSIFRNWPALLGLAANAAVTPKDNDTFSGSLYDAGVNGAANTVGSIADLMHQDDLAAAMYTLANKTQDNTPVQADWDWDYITNPHGLTRSFGNAIGSMAPLLPAAALAPESLVAAAGRLSPWLANGVRYGFTAIPEAMAEGGQTRREAIEDGLNHPDLRAFGTLAKNLPLLAVSNTLEGAILGGGLGKMLAGKAGESVLSRMAKAPFRATPSALAEGLQNGFEEGLQQGIQNASVDKEYGYLPWNWTNDQWDAAREGFFGTLPLGGIGGARKAIFPSVGDVAGTPDNGPDNTDPVVMAQLTGKNDDVPTADGVDVTNLDPQQYTQWYGEKLKAQGIDVPDATITVQTPKATGTTGGAKAGAGANIMDAAQDFMGQHMENGANGCVEAVTKIGARYNPFLADELSKGVVNVDTLVADAGDKVIPFDPNNLEAGDVIVYGDNDHVVLADGNGGYVGNSSSQQKVVQGGDYNNMGGLKPTKIIKTGNGVTAQNETANNGGASAADLSSLPVGDIATAIAQNTGLPANFIWAQLSHESDGGNSKLAREDHNYGGVKGNDGEYLHFDNDQQFIDYMSDYYPKYREDGIYDAQTADQFAEALQHGGYFTADLGEYEGGMHRYLEQAGLSDSGTAGAPAEKQSGGNANTMTQQQFGDMLNEKMIDFAGTNDDTVKAVFNDMSTSKDKALVSLFAPYMQDGVFANTAANRTALVNNDGFKKAMSMFLSKHLSDYAPAFDNGRISFRQAEDALRPRHQVQAAQTAQAPNIQTVASPKMEAAAIQNVLSSFAQDKKNVARTEQEANLFDDMLDADDHFIDTPKNRQTLLKNYGAQLQNYVDDVMTPSLDDRVNQAIEQAVQNKDLNRMNILTQAKQANDTATLEKLVGPQTKQHVDIAAMLTPANTDVKNHVSSMMQGNALVHQTATMEHQAPQNEVASTVQGNTPVQQAPATGNEMPQGKVAPTIQANIPANQAPARMDNRQATQQSAPKEQAGVTPLPTQEAQQTIDEQNAQTDARIAEIKKTPLAQRKALGQQYLDTLRQNNVPFSEKKLAKSLMNGDPEAIEHVQRTYGDLLNTITPAEAAAASQHAPRTIQAATTARLGNMVSEITSGNTYKNASPVGKLAYLSAASAHAKTVGADKSARAIDSIIADVRKKAGFSGKGTTEGMTPEQKDEFYNAFYKQSLDDATAIRKEATDENPANLKSLDNTIEVFKQELAKSKPTKEERKEVTHESTQSKSQNEPDKGTKNQDQHAKPEPRKTADTQREAEESEVSTTKKAADNGGKYVLADGYRTESGKPLLESGENEFILKPNGSKDFGEITDAISKAAKEQSGVDLAPGKIRLRVGNDKEGLLHAKKHEEQANAAGYDSTENMVADIAESFDEIYMREPVGSKTKPTFVLVKHNDRQSGKKNGIAPAYFELKQGADGNFYIVVTAIPMRDRSLKSATKKDRLIYSSPALGAASTSSSSTVSRPRSDNAGATKGVRPTSDKSSGLSTHIIPHEQKEGTKNLDAGKVPGGLSKEAQEVYIAVRDKLHTSKSKARRAADVSAEILARHADTYAKAYSKATGKKYTAADYMRDKIGIDTDGNVVNDEKAKQFFQKAWHGSPHDFDRFDLGAIGTGEGAQVHGWGLYFAANREVSEGYIERLSDVIGHEIAKDGSIVQKSDEEWATIDNAPIDENTPPLVIALKLLREVRAKGNYNIGDAIQKLQWQYIQRMEDDIVASDFLTKWYKKFKYRNTLKNLKAAEQILKEGKYDFKNITSGHLFEVEIPEADTMLDEQLSYSEQPKMVQKAIDALYADRKKLAKEWKNLSAEDFKEIYHPSGEAWTYFMEWNRLRSLNWAFNAFTREDIGNFLRKTSSKNHYPESKIREIENSEQAYNKARNDVRHALANTESYLSKMVERVGVSEDYHDMNGREIYQDYMNALMMYHNISRGWASKNTALALREHGVNGVSYVGGRDGRCYVTFDDKTVKIINKYNQMLNGAAQGYTSALSDGKRVVTLLDGADESTFLHEMGHVFLLDLQDLAEIDQTAANDMAAVEGWTTWKKGQAKEYKGTAWEQEFADRENAIVKAMVDGDEETVNQLKDEWAQERFARGLERYLESGEAPSSKLKDVFEKFKQFLTHIYNAFKGEGGKPSEDVQNVMARMMDSDVENTVKVPPMGKAIIGRTGKETTVTTDSGKTIRVRYRLVPTARVITSHNAETMAANKAYPQELQPRDRQRVSMMEQVTTMANELRPADLGAGRNLNQGAPIIRKDGVVLNGNGRAMAIQKATAAGGDKATAYRKYIFEHSKEFGISRSNLSQMRKYMLVREVVDDIDADTMQDIIGSTAGGSRMGASEQAKADAKKIKPRDLERYVDNEQGDLTTAANRDFVASVLYRIVGKNERNAYTDEHGNVNADGIQRVKRALFSLAYNDDGLIDKMAESTDDNIRNVSRGLMNAAPAFARVNLAVADGQAYPYNADKTVSEAVKRLDALRSEGKPVKDYLNEQSMFSEYQDTDEMREVLRFFDENKRSGKRIGIFLNDMARSILEQGSPNQMSLMEDSHATLGEIIENAERVARDGTTAASLFDNKEESHVDVARSKASVQGDLKKIGKRVVFLPDNSLTSREKGIKEFGEKMGLKVVFFEGPSNLHGMYENGVSFINRSSSTSAPWTFWHETFHWLRHNNPELYRQMVSDIGKKQAFSSEQLQAYRDKTGRQALSDADVIEEMLADAMPDVHRRVSLFRDLGKADAPLLQRFVGWLRDAMRAFHDALTGRKAGLSETQKAAMRDALANIAADLRDSNGKHIFKVNGAEREITAADGTKLSYPARFSGKQETPTIFTAEDRLKADKKAWKRTLRKAWKGDMPDTTMLPVMQTPLVLKLVGAPDYPMVMRQSKLMKIKKDHPEVTKAILNELPSYLADPMIIFKSSTVSGRLVVGTELKDASGANIIVPIELNSKDGRMDVNVITSVYGKGTQQSGTNIAWFVNNIQAGNAVYINKKQAADFYQSAGLQLPMEGRRFNDLFGSSIKTDADLVKSRRENPVRYSLDANDNSTPSLFTRAYNHLTGRKDAASHDKNVKAMLEDITKMRIRFGKLDPATEIVFKKFEGVIRARNANEWEKVLPEAGRAIADRLNLKPSEDMNNYIAKWLLDEATNDTSQEASDFAAALKNDPVLSDQLVDLKTLFNERNNREADEVVRDAIQYEKPKESTTLTKAWETFYDEMIEELGPVKRMVKRVQEKSGQELAASVNPYIALRLFRGNAGRAMTMIEGQSEAAVKALQTNYPGVNFNGFKTLHMILDECGALHNEKRMKDFLAFALACHVKDIHTLNNRIRKSQQRLRDKIADLNDKINNLPEYQQLIESDEKVDDKYQEQREAYQKEIEGYQAKIDKAEKTIMEVPRTEDGLSLTEDRCNKVMMKYMKEYGKAQQDLVHFSKVTTSILYDAGVISKKRYKELQERWPNYIPMFRVFEDNEEVDFGDSLKPMHGSTRRIINPLDSIIRNTYDFVKKAERNKARQLLADLTRISDVGEYIEEVDNSKPNDKTTITFYENGERKYLQTDPDIVKAVNNMGREESNWVLRLLHAPAKIARACFTTINPSFALRNLIRDSTDASIYSKYGFKPWDFVRGFLHAVHRDELFYEWLSSGAAQASAISLDRDYTQATLNQMSKTWKERLLSKEFLPAILEGMQMVGEYSEYGTRIAAYERAKKKLAGENGPHPAAYDLASAALESRDLMDFARGGRGSRYLNNVVVFANASIQGFDKFFRTFDFRKPYRKESMKALARLFLCGMLPALLLAGIHSGDDWWEELPDWQKETNWILGKVGNTIIRIPKGQDIGLRFFSNLIEKAMDRSKHKAGDYFKPVWDSLPDMIPTALLPIIEATANHSYFTGAPVVPKYQEKLPAYLQFGNETSSFAKFVGKVIGVSPRKVEHVLFGYTGNMGKGLLGVYDTIVGNQSLNTNLNEAPVISGFTAIPYKQSKTVNDFYDKFDEQQRLNEEFKLTKKKPDGYDPSLYKRMTKAQQELSKINKQERAAIDDPKMDSGVREQKQLGYQQQRLYVVRRVMGQ